MLCQEKLYYLQFLLNFVYPCIDKNIVPTKMKFSKCSVSLMFTDKCFDRLCLF